ncbi:hypothetical protein [Thalassotalea castellviae]|uniref:Uncharacterized protein n=1 Tax=Thalassotalea castellviae TaxID=3075612 RepID=A0ABU3A343_9GAMM|nr:hypothetical protein [Thalassotalea sp. W431]MDT0604308.1 hypothetical protein [Thalassotalea sp. W431]
MNTIKVSKTAKALFAYKHDLLFEQKNDEQSNEYKKIIRESESARMIATIYEADKLQNEQDNKAHNESYQFQLTHLAASTGGLSVKEYRVDHYNIDKDGTQTLVKKDAFKIDIHQEKNKAGYYLVRWKFDESEESSAFMDDLFEQKESPKIKLYLTSDTNTQAEVTELASIIMMKEESEYQHESPWEKYCPAPNEVDEKCRFYIEINHD